MKSVRHALLFPVLCLVSCCSLFARPEPLLDYKDKDKPLQGCSIPTESFVTGNSRILATIKSGQLVTDHNFGLASFHWPTKESVSRIQSTRIQLLVDGEWVSPYDHDDRSTVRKRGYERQSGVVNVQWADRGIQVRDQYFVPTDLDVVIQRSTLKNTSDQKKKITVFGILYPQLGSPAPHLKGVCKDARYEEKDGILLVEDTMGTTLVYGFNGKPNNFQVGEVCSNTDVYYVLEEKRLNGVQSQKSVVVNAALSLELGELAPGEERTYETVVGAAKTQQEAGEVYAKYLAGREQFAAKTREYWKQWLASGKPFYDIEGWGDQLREYQEVCRMALNLHLNSSGVPMCGATSKEYHGAVSVRNAGYYLISMDEAGYTQQTVKGYRGLMEFKQGDPRFFSADENDQLGTLLYITRRHYDLTKDKEFLKEIYPSVQKFSEAIIRLLDPKYDLIYSERALHEFVAVERGYETYVNSMAFRGLSDAAFMAGELGKREDAARYTEDAEKLRKAILTHLYDEENKTFVKRVYQGRKIALPAVSMMTPALLGVLDAKDERVTSTLQFMLGKIWDPKIGGVYRYPLHLQPWDEHPYGGTWIFYTSWLMKVYLLRGDLENARTCAEWIFRNIPQDSKLAPEHLSVGYAGKRGYYRVYLEPVVGETLAIAEGLEALRLFAEAVHKAK